MKRKAISKKLRFEVFKRDSFSCQYCGKKSPDVILEVDHINPYSKGGTNDILNLITACYDCNRGKSAEMLNEHSILSKQRKQLDMLNERREQLKLMTMWKQGLMKLEEDQINIIEELISVATDYGFSELGRKKCLNTIRKCGFEIVYDATQTAINQYLKTDKDGNKTKDSIDNIFKMYQRIAISNKNGGMDDDKKQLYYIRGIVRNRMFCKDYEAIRLLSDVFNSGVSIDELKKIALNARNWTEWKDQMNELIQE